MSKTAIDQVLFLLEQSEGIKTIDITGGAPEMHPHFRHLVTSLKRLKVHVMDRCNLTILSEPGHEETAHFLAMNQVEIFASLPCYGPENVDAQRGIGVFKASIQGLRTLNALGYGRPGTGLLLNLVYNPLGASLPPAQQTLEKDYKQHLLENFGVYFNALHTITNMPISRFKSQLQADGQLDTYLKLLIDNFNVDTVPNVMCRDLISVSWTGHLYDCDFNQMVDLPIQNARQSIWDLDSFDELFGAPISTDTHCFACTAGAGSSCGGALT